MTRRLLLAFLVLLFPAAVVAHEGNGPHGGPAVDAGPYFVELITQDGQIKFFVFNEETSKPQDMKGVRGSATVLMGQQREVVQLQHDPSDKDGNLLSGKMTLKPGPGMRVVVQLQVPGQPSVSARYAL